MAEDNANPMPPMENNPNGNQPNDYGNAAADGGTQPGGYVSVDGNTQPMGYAPVEGNAQFNGYAPADGTQPGGYAPMNGYATQLPHGGASANGGYAGGQPYAPTQPMHPVQPVQSSQNSPFANQQLPVNGRPPKDKPQADTSKIMQYATLAISIVALILGIAANVHVVKPYRLASVSAPTSVGDSAKSKKDSDSKAKDSETKDSTAKSESESTGDDSSAGTSGKDLLGKYAGTVDGKKMYELNLPGARGGNSQSGDSKSSGSRGKGYTVSADSNLDGDYELGDYNLHLEITNFEATGTSATLTTEVTNNGTSGQTANFVATLSQNGKAVDLEGIDTAGKTIEPGHKAIITTKFRLNDPSQPVTIEIPLAGEKMRITFTPQS